MMAEDTQEDLSMEDILSSIRNILMEDNANQQVVAEDVAETPEIAKSVEPIIAQVEEKPLELAPEDILNLSPSMIIEAPEAIKTEAVIDVESDEDISMPDIEINSEDIDFINELAGFNVTPEPEVNEEINPEPDITSFLSEEDPTDASVMAEEAASEESITDIEDETAFEVMDSHDLDSNFIENDINAEPIFSPEEDNLPHDYNMETEDTSIENEMVNLGIDEVADEDSANALVDDSTLNEILNIHAQDEAERFEEQGKEEYEEEVKEEVVKDDAVDISANIISNFARMFADKHEVAETIPEDVKNIPSMVCDNIALGNGSLTLEEIVKDTVRGVVEKNLQSINNIATQEIHRQTKVWLDENLPKMVEAVVKQEIERVMVKVGR